MNFFFSYQVVIIIQALPDFFGNMILYRSCILPGAGNIIKDRSAIIFIQQYMFKYFVGLIA